MASFKEQKDYTQLLKNLKKRYKAGDMTKAEYDTASLNIRREKTAALRAGAEKARKAADSWISGGTFGKWLTTPASVSEILGGRNAKKSTVKTAASENIGAVSGAKPQKKGKNASTAAAPKKKTRSSIAEMESQMQQKLEAARKKFDKTKGTKNYNVGVSKGGVSFNQAFAHFRKKGNKTFTWNGKKYTTELKKGK